MDLFGVNGDDSDDLEPLSPPNKRCARELFTATGRSAHVAAAEQQQHAGFLDFEAFDLNSQAQTWPRVTDMLQSSPIPNYLEAEVGRDLCSKSVSHLGMPSSHPGVAQPSSSWGVNVATNAAKSCRTPRTAGASTRAARGSRRSATTHKRTARSSGASRGNRNGATATRIHNMPSFSGAPPQQQYENDDLEDGLSQINFRGRACRQPPNSSAVSARQPPMPAGASGGCGTPHNGDGVGWSDSIHMFSEEDGGHNMDDEGFFDDSSTNSSSTDEDEEAKKFVLQESQVMQQYGAIACMFGMYYYDTFMNKSRWREPKLSGHEWVLATLNSPADCFNMFRMRREIFHRLHDLLVARYGLRSTKKMKSVEALAMFLWILGAPQSARQVENRFQRSTETVSRKFKEVLDYVYRLSVDIIKPKDPEFRTVHPRLRGSRYAPFFDNCIGAIDGTHVQVVVPAAKMLQYVGRHGYPSQNVLAVCDFDMRFTFAVAGWPGSVHDMRVFTDALTKYGDKFPHPPEGKFYLVDSGYQNRLGYLAPYKGTKYHLPEFRQGPGPSGKKEVFNFVHSSLRNVIERSFGVLKMKWRILLQMPSYPLAKQSKIILACMALHNFIRESALVDVDFDMCDRDENYVPNPGAASSQHNDASKHRRDEDHSMNVFRDSIADGLFAMRP